MNREFAENALIEAQTARERLIEGERALAALNRVGSASPTASPAPGAIIRAGNRHERRKAAKLARTKG